MIIKTDITYNRHETKRFQTVRESNEDFLSRISRVKRLASFNSIFWKIPFSEPILAQVEFAKKLLGFFLLIPSNSFKKEMSFLPQKMSWFSSLI